MQKDREDDLLARINAVLPPGIDWKEGAQTYLAEAVGAQCLSGPLSQYMYTKPFSDVGNGERSVEVFVDLMANFTSVVSLLKLPAGSRILDVACGAGWLSHYLAKLGYAATGIEISSDMIACAERRLAEDKSLPPSGRANFLLCDLETEPLQETSAFDAAIFESCLHHFYNPIAALRHVADGLREDGVAVLIEGENRKGGLKEEYLNEMKRYRTIERPYARAELESMLRLAGLPCYEFFGRINGWISTRVHTPKSLWAHATESSDGMNHTVCAKNAAAMRKILPWWTEPAATRS